MIPSIRRRAYVYVASALALIAVAWAVAQWSIRQEQQRSFSESAERARQLALFFERHTLGIVRYGDAYVKLARREYVKRGDLGAVHRLLDDVPLDLSIVSHLTIVDETGTPVFNSRYDIRPGTTAVDRAYFRYQRKSERDELYVSLPLRGRNSDRLIFRLVRRINTPEGRFGGVIFAAIDAGSITQFFSAMNLGPRSSATLVGTDKKIRARSSYGRLGPGQDISGSRIWSELEQSSVGLYRQTSVVDDITRYYAYRRLAAFPLIVAIGVSVEDISLAVSEFRYPAYSIAALVTILVVTMIILILREISVSERLTASEQRVRRMRDELEERFQARTAELELVQKELMVKERLAVLGQLTGTVAHELRNPMNTISASTAVIERRLQDSHIELGSVVDRLLRNVDRCNSIITELLDFARATGVKLTSTEIDPWLSDLLRDMEPRNGVTIGLALGAPGVVVEMDQERLRRAVINLLNNACDAVESSAGGLAAGQVDVSSRVENGRVEIAVTDNGPGIPDELMDRVREPLFSTKTFGVGLGIPIVQRIMKEHNGGFDISTSQTRGTCAVLWLWIGPRESETSEQ